MVQVQHRLTENTVTPQIYKFLYSTKKNYSVSTDMFKKQPNFYLQFLYYYLAINMEFNHLQHYNR
jgi:hypothetical protein